MLAAERQAVILAEVTRAGTATVGDLVDRLGVSDMTVRRDLLALHQRGALVKVHGGAMALRVPSTDEPGFAAKSSQRLAAKKAIAARAAELVKPGSAIAISAGTTTYAFAELLTSVPGLTVVTNSYWVADTLHRHAGEGSTVMLTGGTRTPSDAFVGPLAVSAVANLHVNAFFLGVHGMDEFAGLTTPNLLESETNRALIRNSDQLVVLADSSKWGTVGLSSMAQLDEITTVVSDNELPDAGRRVLSDEVGELVLVAPTHPDQVQGQQA